MLFVKGPRSKLAVERLGPLPVVNRFLDRLGLDELLAEFVPSQDRESGLSYAKALGVLLRSIIVEREPIYRQQETVQTFAPGAFGVDEREAAHLSDDRVGRALDRLFDADRTALLTKTVLRMGKRFEVRFDELHNDSTTIRFTGQYREARGRRMRGKRAPWITYGFSKDHRPDLKQLLFILTTSADGGVPVQFRCEDGNRADVDTHVKTWEALRRVAGKPDFLYVGDSKLCETETMDYIDAHKGRFVTVLPRTRSEDAHFRKRIQTEEPQWEPVWDRRNPRRKYGPRDRWWVWLDPLPSQEAWPIIWVYSSLLRLKHDHTRRERLAQADEALKELKRRLCSPRSKLRKPNEVEKHVERILRRYSVARYLKVEKFMQEEHRYRQNRRGRPGKQTSYRRITRRHWDIEWTLDKATVEYDRKSDGMYPLLTNDKELTPTQVLEAHKGQIAIENRFRQVKSVHEIAPVLLHNEGRIEALFFLYFLALLVQGLIERELRRAMEREGIETLALYPEERESKHPTTEQVLRLFSLLQRNVLLRRGRAVEIFEPEFTELQRLVLRLLGVPPRAYRRAR
ncbi:MAG: IS1634 family transposase [Dehalococcoidia bacterium]